MQVFSEYLMRPEGVLFAGQAWDARMGLAAVAVWPLIRVMHNVARVNKTI
jgi:hypothetical protein